MKKEVIWKEKYMGKSRIGKRREKIYRISQEGRHLGFSPSFSLKYLDKKERVLKNKRMPDEKRKKNGVILVPSISRRS